MPPFLVDAVHVVFDSDLDRETLPGHWCERTHVTRANQLLDSPQMHPPKMLCKAFRLTALADGREITLLSVDQNIKRAYHQKIGFPIEAIRLTPLSNWGETDATNLISFDFR